MGIKAGIQNRVMKHLFSIKRREARRRKCERQRQATGKPHLVEYYHEVGDPYSHLMVQVLPELCRRYGIELQTHLVSPPPDWAAPDRVRLDDYARRDAALLAERANLDFSDFGEQPSGDAIASANGALVSAVESGTFLQRAYEVGQCLWRGEQIEIVSADRAAAEETLKSSAEKRDRQGHYLGGTLFYAGEWYWGLDRLHFLEQRLKDLGVAVDASEAPIFEPPVAPAGATPNRPEVRPVMHWYLSFRSPYTGIVANRVKALAEAYGAELKLRFVLPMVMRGMQVPRMKGFYIMSDTIREAERLGIPFGDICDPVGRPVERGYAILSKAIGLGRGLEFAQSFLSGVWADGLDAGSDSGLKKITERAGLDWAEMKPFLGGDHWRAKAEANQAEMFAHGIWGVPSFRVGEVAAWGQDRLWVIEDALKSLTESEQSK